MPVLRSLGPSVRKGNVLFLPPRNFHLKLIFMVLSRKQSVMHEEYSRQISSLKELVYKNSSVLSLRPTQSSS